MWHEGLASKFHPAASGQTVPVDAILYTQYGLCDANLQAF